ncbi:AbrB/MazE/SpoVT family DNA-binding domain-containing protein [Chryseobacterium suipulveris]|uniref:AbrB/MazE/SpoVT family DNA-binding domain-containing protein n=1 Tax=Chryseobacterium suipulveris TaxID=2929800 RepID=A0ABY4BTX8_9FLAO|nr:AbrB/MazE/SpoVT family DNA-binding domain-containing protein [Chryseobacterium suipulveris]UOE42339.1 AbrB/MazE/SpoVT family DNA-binding domain-containing protein [Chryseobacterium suipulveris]
MTTRIRKIGNSSGIIISKAMLDQLNIEPKDELELYVEGDKILIKKVKQPREGWEEQFKNADLLEGEEDLMDFNNQFDDEEWTW